MDEIWKDENEPREEEEKEKSEEMARKEVEIDEEEKKKTIEVMNMKEYPCNKGYIGERKEAHNEVDKAKKKGKTAKEERRLEDPTLNYKKTEKKETEVKETKKNTREKIEREQAGAELCQAMFS